MRGPKPNGTLVLLAALFLPLPGPPGPEESASQELEKAGLLGTYRPVAINAGRTIRAVEPLGGDSLTVRAGPLVLRDTTTFTWYALLFASPRLPPASSVPLRPTRDMEVIERRGTWEAGERRLTLRYDDGTVETALVRGDTVAVIAYDLAWVYTLLTRPALPEAALRENLASGALGRYNLWSIDGEKPSRVPRLLAGDTVRVFGGGFYLDETATFRLEVTVAPPSISDPHTTDSLRTKHTLRGAWQVEDGDLTFYHENGTVDRGEFYRGHCVALVSHGARWVFGRPNTQHWRAPECP